MHDLHCGSVQASVIQSTSTFHIAISNYQMGMKHRGREESWQARKPKKKSFPINYVVPEYENFLATFASVVLQRASQALRTAHLRWLHNKPTGRNADSRKKSLSPAWRFLYEFAKIGYPTLWIRRANSCPIYIMSHNPRNKTVPVCTTDDVAVHADRACPSSQQQTWH